MTHIEVTTKIGCPIRCTYCPQNLLSYRYNELFPNAPKMLSYETFEKCLINLGPERGVHFTGFAEPWSNPDCTRFLLLAIQQKRRIKISTTAQGLKPKDAKKILDYDYSLFEIHLPDDRELMPGHKISTEYLQTLEIFAQANLPSMRFRVLASPTCPPEVEELLSKHPDINFHSKRVHDRGANVPKEDFEQIGATGTFSVKTSNFRGHPLRCSKKFNQPVLLPNGYLTSCCTDYGLKLMWGSLLENSYSQLRNSPIISQYKEDLLCWETRNRKGYPCNACCLSQVVPPQSSRKIKND